MGRKHCGKRRNCLLRGGMELTVYYEIQTLNKPDKKNPLKSLWEKEEMLLQAFSAFPTMFLRGPAWLSSLVFDS